MRDKKYRINCYVNSTQILYFLQIVYTQELYLILFLGSDKHDQLTKCVHKLYYPKKQKNVSCIKLNMWTYNFL